MSFLMQLNSFIWPVVSVSAWFIIKAGLWTLQLFIFCISWHKKCTDLTDENEVGSLFSTKKVCCTHLDHRMAPLSLYSALLLKNHWILCRSAEDWNKQNNWVSIKMLFRTCHLRWRYIGDERMFRITSCKRTNNKY